MANDILNKQWGGGEHVTHAEMQELVNKVKNLEITVKLLSSLTAVEIKELANKFASTPATAEEKAELLGSTIYIPFIENQVLITRPFRIMHIGAENDINGQGAIYLMSKFAMPTQLPFNSECTINTDTTDIGKNYWSNSTIKTWLNETFYSSVRQDWKKIIGGYVYTKRITVSSDSDKWNYSYITTNSEEDRTQDHFFLPGVQELLGWYGSKARSYVDSTEMPIFSFMDAGRTSANSLPQPNDDQHPDRWCTSQVIEWLNRDNKARSSWLYTEENFDTPVTIALRTTIKPGSSTSNLAFLSMIRRNSWRAC